MAPTRYVALGSSFAAGPGIVPTSAGTPAKARQSGANYPHLFAQRSRLDLTDRSSSGATVEDVLRRPTFGLPPQITAVTAGTDLVTVTVGGNDIGYIPSLITASLPAWFSRLPILGRQLRRATAPARADDRLDRTAHGVSELFGVIRDRAPSARIICVDYLTVLPPTFRPELPFSEPTHGTLIGLAGDLDQALARACAEHHVELLRASSASRDHHAWADQPWTTGWVPPRPGRDVAFHPTAAGMSAVADLLVHHLEQ